MDRRNDGSFIRENGLVEGEENGAEEGCGLFTWASFEFRVDINDKG